jgi:hypothetical protein
MPPLIRRMSAHGAPDEVERVIVSVPEIVAE